MDKTVDSNLYWRTPREELPVCQAVNCMRSWPVWACAIRTYEDSHGKKHRFRDIVKAEFSAHGEWYIYITNEQIEVTHWMPMPTLPPEEGGGQ